MSKHSNMVLNILLFYFKQNLAVLTTSLIWDRVKTVIILKQFVMIIILMAVPAHHHINKHDQYWKLAGCESNHQTHINTGNGFYGAFQFDYQTWKANSKYNKLPSYYSYKIQKKIAIKLHHRRGWEPWPSCSAQLGFS